MRSQRLDRPRQATDEKDSDGCSDDGRDSISPTNIMDVPDKSHYTNVIDAPDEVRLPLSKRQVFTELDYVEKRSSSIVRAMVPDKKSCLQEPGTNAAPYKSWDKRLEQLTQHFETHGDFECQKDEQLWRNVDEKVIDTDEILVCDDNGTYCVSQYHLTL
jgi:hypothetical protein